MLGFGAGVMADKLRRLSTQYGFKYYVSHETGSGADHQGYLNPSVLSQWLGQPDADVYFCGPTPFMAAVNTTLLGMGDDADASYIMKSSAPAPACRHTELMGAGVARAHPQGFLATMSTSADMP